VVEALLAFCAELRERHAFRIGPGEEADALRALELVGVEDERRARSTLRTVLCTSRDELARFEVAFDAFFLDRNPDRARARPLIVSEAQRSAAKSNDQDLVESWPALIARYSPAAGAGEAPEIARDSAGDFARAASRLIASVRRGRSRRWHPQPRGPRLDERRTLRASLRTAGDPVLLRRLGHPHRNPRFVLILDGSRSMTPHADVMLGFAEALVRRSLRVRVLLFSTEVRDVTRDLRAVHRAGARALERLGAAWGGGTRIGAALRTFVRDGARWLSPDTTVLVFSDGLDGAGGEDLRRALHAIRRAGAETWWVHPHADAPGFTPATAALRIAAPYITAFLGFPALSVIRNQLWPLLAKSSSPAR